MNIKKKRHVPVVLQIEVAECGAACLCMVMAYYKKYVSLSQVRKDCKISKDGSRLSYLIEAANGYGFDTTAAKMSIEALANRTMPAIVFWDFAHYVVVERVGETEVTICDPSIGRRTISLEEFCKHFTGIVLLLTPNDNFTPGGKKFSSLKVVSGLVSNVKSVIIYLSILLILLNVIGLVIPGMTTLFMDYYLPVIGSANMATFFSVFVMILAIQTILLICQKKVIKQFDRNISGNVNNIAFSKLLKLPLIFFQNRSNSTIVQQLSSMDTVSEIVSCKFIPTVLGFVFSLIYAVLLFSYNPIIGLSITLVIAIVLVVVMYLMKKSKALVSKSIGSSYMFFGLMNQNIKLFDTIKSTAQEKKQTEMTMTSFIDYENSIQESKAWMAVMNAIPIAVPVIIQSLTLIVGSMLYFKGKMTMGMVLACQSIGMSIFSPITIAISNISEFQFQESNIKGLNDIFTEEDDALSTRDNAPAGIEFDSVELKNVFFGYKPAQPPFLKDISLCANKGKSMAIVGGSGCGKSTVVKLIEGLYSVQSGEILIGGMPLDKTSRDEIEANIAVVAQTPYLFTGTIKENITLFDGNISKERLDAALKDACIYDEVYSRKNSIEEMVDPNSSTFSGGEIQRLMIARALVKNPKILILDEATSALDTLVEQEIMRNVKARNITLIMVAHRISTVVDCDEILVMNNGEIIERGTHNQLMSNENSEYRKLVLSGENKGL